MIHWSPKSWPHRLPHKATSVSLRIKQGGRGAKEPTHLHHCCRHQAWQTECQWQKHNHNHEAPSWRLMLRNCFGGLLETAKKPAGARLLYTYTLDYPPFPFSRELDFVPPMPRIPAHATEGSVDRAYQRTCFQFGCNPGRVPLWRSLICHHGQKGLSQASWYCAPSKPIQG